MAAMTREMFPSTTLSLSLSLCVYAIVSVQGVFQNVCIV